MGLLFRSICADFQKTKHFSFRIIHLVLPLCISGVFVAYYSFSPWNAVLKAEVYLQVLGISLPFIIGLLCAVLTEQESSAGNFQEMLSAQSRTTSLYSKLFLLLVFGLFAILLSCALFGLGFALFCKKAQLIFQLI